jgi:acyl-CoA thioester hydrolase
MSSPRTVYRSFVRVRFGECDPYGHVNNAVYLGYLEQVAFDHADICGWPVSRLQAEVGAVFVARRHELEFLQPAFEGDLLEITTWPEGMSMVRTRRHYFVRKVAGEGFAIPAPDVIPYTEFTPPERRDLIIQATTEWAFVNLERGRAMRIPQHVLDGFLQESES